MVVYTLEQRCQILRHYFEDHGHRKCAKIVYGFWKMRSTVSSEYSLSCGKSERKEGILIDKSKRKKPKTVRTPQNIAAVAESVHEAPSTAIHRCFQQLNISETSLRRN